MPRPYYLRVRPDRGNQWYVSYYHNGKQTPWKSTGTANKAEAEKWAGEHNPATAAQFDNRTFGLFARGWFQNDHEWVVRQTARGRNLSPGYLDGCRGVLRKHVLPKWRVWALEDITTAAIDDWLFELKDPPPSPANIKRKKVPLSSSSINTCLSVLRVMLRYAARKGYIKSSPAVDCERMVGGGRKRGILTILEAKTLFDEANIQKLWRGNIPLYTINLIGASAGLRIGEIQGLQVKHIRLDETIPHIEVRQSWHGKHGIGKTKTAGSVRDVPLPALTIKYLRLAIAGKAAEDLVFPGDEGHHLHGTQHEQIPIDAKWVNLAFVHAMNRADIKDYRERYITLHSHRHYYVTIMRGKMPEHLLRALTGHTTVEMTNRYSHPQLSDVATAAQIQDAILSA